MYPEMLFVSARNPVRLEIIFKCQVAAMEAAVNIAKVCVQEFWDHY